MTALPVAFKTLLSAFKRAEELDRDPQRENRIVAYHIRFYAITKATKLMTGAPDEQRYVGEQIGLLEKLAPALNIQDGEGKRVCIQQATTLFDRADEIDRAGLADKATAKLFYTAATIYDCLEQFGEQDPEILERKKYAKWKSTDIVNAINSGQRPTPGGFGEAAPESVPQAPSGFDIPAAPVNKPVNLAPLQQPAYQQSPPPPAAYAPPPQAPVYQQPPQPAYQPPPQPVYSPPPQPAYHPPAMQQPQNYQWPAPAVNRGPPQSPADPRVKDAIELSQFAISALNHNNVGLARERLQEALRRLG